MPLNFPGLFGWKPLLAGIVVVAESSFFSVSTEITRVPWARHFFTTALMCLNCASRSG